MPRGVYNRNTKPLSDRLMARVVKGDDCWLWVGTKNELGYGHIQVDKNNRHMKVHRASWTIFVGPIPDGMCVLHKCDVPNCINPAHLFLGTKAENSLDMVRKGRQKKGEQLGHAKLTVADIIKIRAGTDSQTVTAKQFGITSGHVSLIRARKSWKHVP